ncbi:hypothetical protein GIB67_017310 [Kingdonia uniflora]|uniref:AB hydrolase-1 domain-containing protein n=1 Tax=Kingdonia uniflora TaxID=39325 RepID=A0A7J7N5V0_9MAGN|nr:hypothetical protein GIB67_017310 [Kingdonia uniflora]
MVNSCLSIVPFYRGYLHRSFTSSGLIQQNIQIDSETHIYFWGPPPGLFKSKHPLVLIHGFGPCGFWQWRNQIPFLSRHFDLYAPDLLFFGESTTTSLERSNIFQATCLTKLLEKLELPRYYVMGTNYGGFVAYQMARLWPKRVEKLVIASSAINRNLDDDTDLLELTKLDKIEDLLIPINYKNFRLLMEITMKKRVSSVSDFILSDIL